MSAELLEYRHALPGGEYMQIQMLIKRVNPRRMRQRQRTTRDGSNLGRHREECRWNCSIIIISILLLVLSVAVVVALVQLWPLSSSSTSVHGTHYLSCGFTSILSWNRTTSSLSSWRRTWWCIHSLRSIAFFVEKESCNGPGSLLRMPTIVASLMAMIFYLVLRGTYLLASKFAGFESIRMAAIAGLSACSDQAASMLKRYFQSLHFGKFRYSRFRALN